MPRSNENGVAGEAEPHVMLPNMPLPSLCMLPQMMALPTASELPPSAT
jgi:hypothetical protein